MMVACSGGESGNCIAVVVGGHLTQENVPPTAAFFSGDGELESGFACGVTEDRGTGKEAPAQRSQLGPLGLAEPTLQTDAQVVGADGQMTGRLGRPERPAAQSLQTELRAQFFNTIFDIGAPVIAAPDFERVHARWQIGPQSLEPVARHIEELFPAGLRTLG